MQGEWTGELVGPDVWVTCRELIPAGSVFAFLAEHREHLFPGLDVRRHVSLFEWQAVDASAGAGRGGGVAGADGPVGFRGGSGVAL